MHRKAQISSQKSNNLSEIKNICPHCHKDKTKKMGFRMTKERGKQQRYYCKNCYYSFTLNTGFWKMKKPDNIVGQTIETYLEGLSLRKMSNNISKFSTTKISHQTVLNWLHKYSIIARELVKTMKPKLCEKYYADETFIPVRKRRDYYSVVMDSESRYVIGTKYMEEGITAKGNIELWREADHIQRPKKFQTDSHPTYNEVFRKVFWSRYSERKVEWIKHNCSKSGKFNYRIERLFNSLKDRVRITRGFKASWSAKLILDAYFINYNFIRRHMGLQMKTPSEITMTPKYNNWTDLINICFN